MEDIRTLTEGVYTLPFASPYKVYILDEAHMLSKSAWNAFLKTLEEPPAYAVFILATTELEEKVPETVQSRCQVFEFKKPTRAVLAKMATAVAKKEGYTLAPDTAELIALLAEGSYRDALSVLQKVFAATEVKTLSREVVEQATDAPRQEQVHALVSALAGGERGKALAAIEQAAKTDADMELFLELVLERSAPPSSSATHPSSAPRSERARRGRILRSRKIRKERELCTRPCWPSSPPPSASATRPFPRFRWSSPSLNSFPNSLSGDILSLLGGRLMVGRQPLKL